MWRWDQQEPFGVNVADENPSGLGVFDLPLRLPGQYFDKETNLAYNFFRDYDSGFGRYIQSDPIGLAGGINTYAYVNSNALINRDPLGLSSHGCGAGPAYRGIPNLWFRECCDAHDACYANCKELPPKSQCDGAFCGCVFSKCTGWTNSAACRALAGSYCAAGTQSEQSQRSFDESREKCKRTPLACATPGQS